MAARGATLDGDTSMEVPAMRAAVGGLILVAVVGLMSLKAMF